MMAFLVCLAVKMEPYPFMEPYAIAGLLVWGASCAVQDALQRRISNWLTLSAALFAGLYLALSGQTLLAASLGQGLTALILALLLSLPGYLTGKMGAGDVKMLAALALASNLLFTLTSIAVAALGVALWALASPRLWPRLPRRWQCKLPLFAPDQQARLPYAPFLFIGLLVASGWHLLSS